MIIRIIIIILLIIISRSLVYAQYILPYPSYMPGNKIYKVSRILDTVKNWWSFGDIAQVKYHMSLSDKYLVEAKTLFEYNQYLLGVDALKRSDSEFIQIPSHIKQGEKNGKVMKVWKRTLSDAAKVHMDVLDKLILICPNEFQWSPEKDSPTMLPLHELLYKSIGIRSTILQE